MKFKTTWFAMVQPKDPKDVKLELSKEKVPKFFKKKVSTGNIFNKGNDAPEIIRGLSFSI